MARRMRRSSRRVDVSRRKRVWARQSHTINGVGQTGVAENLFDDFSNEYGTSMMTHPVGITVAGIWLDFNAVRATAGTTDPTSDLHVGIIATEEDTAADVERPLDEPHADWMWWQRIHFSSLAVDANPTTMTDYPPGVHIKAQRKLEELGSNLWIVFQGYDVAPTFNVAYNTSVLMLLP